MHSLARFWIDRNKAIRRQYSPRFYKEILNEWGLFLMQFFAPIFIEFVSRHILLHNGTRYSPIQTIHHWKNSRYYLVLITFNNSKILASCRGQNIKS